MTCAGSVSRNSYSTNDFIQLSTNSGDNNDTLPTLPWIAYTGNLHGAVLWLLYNNDSTMSELWQYGRCAAPPESSLTTAPVRKAQEYYHRENPGWPTSQLGPNQYESYSTKGTIMKRKRELDLTAIYIGVKVTLKAPVQGYFYSGQEQPSPLPIGVVAIVKGILGNGLISIRYKDDRRRKAKAEIPPTLIDTIT